MERATLWKIALVVVAAVIALFSLPIWRQRVPARVQESPYAVPKARTGFRFQYDKFCDTLFNSGGWVGMPTVSCDGSTKSVATCGASHTDNWQWSSEALRCGAQRLGAPELRPAFKGRWLLIAGDSIARYFYAALLRVLSADITQTVVYGHRDFEYQLPGNIRASFVWAPYADNLTELYSNWTRMSSGPDAVVMSAGLWHMLHITDLVDYASDLQRLKAAIEAFRSEMAAVPPLSFFSISEVYPPKLKTEDKRLHLTLPNVDKYNNVINESGILVPDGSLYLIDLHHLTQGCGPACTHDGLHYSNATYDAAFQIWANNLLSLMKPS